MNILVTGGTGTVGSQVVRDLSGTGHTVKVLTRDPAKAGKLQGAEPVAGNLLQPETVRRIFNGIDAVFLLNGLGQTETTEGLMAVNGMREAGVKRVVYMSVHRVDEAAWLPHFGSKVGIEEAVKRSGMAFTILRPNNFYQNDYWFKDVILQFGIYPQPLGGVGVSRVDVRDIAEVAVAALTSSGHDGQTYDLVGPDPHTGESTARAWSEALNRSIKYGGNDLEAWEKQQLQYLPDYLAYDFRHMYKFFQEKGLKASAEAIDRLTRVLGHPPRTYEAFVRETVSAWAATV